MSDDSIAISQQLIDIFDNVIRMELRYIIHETKTNLSFAEIHTIVAVGVNELKSMSETAKALHITVGTLTVAINNLVRKGFVERFKSEKDRRFVKVGLTKSGKEVYAAHEQFHKTLAGSMLHDLSDNELKTIYKGLTNLDDFITKWEEY